VAEEQGAESGEAGLLPDRRASSGRLWHDGQAAAAARRAADLRVDDGSTRRAGEFPAAEVADAAVHGPALSLTWRRRDLDDENNDALPHRRRRVELAATWSGGRGGSTAAGEVAVAAAAAAFLSSGDDDQHRHWRGRRRQFRAKAREVVGGASSEAGGTGGGWRSPLDLEEAGGRRCFPGVLQETAAAAVPSNGDGKTDAAILKETGAGGLIPESPAIKSLE
jgi:hypothetical protein